MCCFHHIADAPQSQTCLKAMPHCPRSIAQALPRAAQWSPCTNAITFHVAQPQPNLRALRRGRAVFLVTATGGDAPTSITAVSAGGCPAAFFAYAAAMLVPRIASASSRYALSTLSVSMVGCQSYRNYANSLRLIDEWPHCPGQVLASCGIFLAESLSHNQQATATFIVLRCDL